VKTVFIIAGPTASGKSGLALTLAAEQQGCIINADSMQVYSPYPVLTAQPDAAARREAPHHLYGHITPPETGSAASWRAEAQDVAGQAFNAGQTPFLVGGTGLYLEALMYGLSDIPDVPDDIREETKDLHRVLGAEGFHKALAEVDAETAARLAPGDTQRVIRAYEVHRATGQPISHWQSAGLQPPPADWRFTAILLLPPRDTLYAAIDRRFDGMMQNGALEEVVRAKNQGISPDHPARKAVGVRELEAVLDDTLPLSDAVEKARQASRNYAKRQYTWFRNRFSARMQEKAWPLLVLETVTAEELNEKARPFVRKVVDA
jgi:tRNA dimethylallyltransferase